MELTEKEKQILLEGAAKIQVGLEYYGGPDGSAIECPWCSSSIERDEYPDAEFSDLHHEKDCNLEAYNKIIKKLCT